MKILGHSGLKRRTEEVGIGESLDDGVELKLTLTAPRLNSIDKINDELDPPPPPAVPEAPSSGAVARTPRGEVIKDDMGRPVVARNYNDPNYLEQIKAHDQSMADYGKLVTRYARARTMGTLLECLGGQLEIDAKRDDYEGDGKKGTLIDYYGAVWKEFEDCGIDIVSLGKLSDAALRLVGAGVTDDEITDGKAALGTTSGN